MIWVETDAKCALTGHCLSGKRASQKKHPRAKGDFQVAKPDLGTKRTCPETGKNFYDLNKDPIVSPYTGQEYALSFFETAKPTKATAKAKPDPETPADDDDEIEDDADTGRAKGETDGDDDEDEDDEAKALELGEDADEVVIEGGDDDDDGDTPGGVPAGFTEEGVDDDEDDVILDSDDDDFDIDVDDDIDLDGDDSDPEDEDKA